MDIRETISVAIDALRANKLRAMLTSLGVIIGSASIVLVVTVALTSKKFVISQIESIGSNLVWAELVQRQDKPQPLSHEMSLEDLEAAKNIPNVIAVAGTRALSHLESIGIPLLHNVQVDITALGFILVMAVVTGLVFGLAPALHIPAAAVHDALKETGRGSTEGHGQIGRAHV